MNISLSWSTKKGVAIVALSAMLFAVLFSGVSTALADSLSVTDSGTLDSGVLNYVSSVDASGYENLVFSFDYNAEALDDGDSFTYGWREAGGANNELGSVSGSNEDELGTTTEDEIGHVSVSLPAGAQVANLELYISATVDAGAESDTISLSNITLEGHEAPTGPTCDTDESTFDSFETGNVDGQNGWRMSGSYDQSIIENTSGYPDFGCKSLQVSNAVTSGSFDDWIFTPAISAAVSETDPESPDLFEAEFDIASIQSDEQPGLQVSVAADNGEGGRMSYLRFEDQADGIHVFFDDVQSTAAPVDWTETDIATLSRTEPHTIKLTVEPVEGPSNDIVKVYVDGELAHTGTSWENYYRFDDSGEVTDPVPPEINSLIIQARGSDSHPELSGKGFLFDNLTLSTDDVDESPAPEATIEIHTIDELNYAIKHQEDGQTWTIHEGAYGLGPTDVSAGGQTGWYFPITANNIKINGVGNPTIYGTGYTKNGNWSTQDLVAVFGDNVTIDGLTFMPKVQPNKTIEVIGANFTLLNSIIEPNTLTDPDEYNQLFQLDPGETNADYKQWGGSLYFNHAGDHMVASDHLVKNVIIHNGGVSFRNSATSTHISFDNVSIVDETNVDWINAYRFSSGFNNPDTSISGTPTITYRASAELNNLGSILANVKAGDVIEFGNGTYAQDLTIDKGITLKAAEGSTPVIQGKILISASDVSIDGLTITNPSFAGGQTIHGVQIWSAGPVISNISLKNNTFTNIANSSAPVKGAYGIMVQGHVSGVTIDSNTISDIHSSGWARGIEVTPTCSDTSVVPVDVTISNNTVSDIVSETGDAYALSVDAATCGENPAVSANAGEVTISGNDFQGDIRDLDPDHDINGVINPPSDEEDDDLTLDSDTQGEVTVEDDTIVLSNTSNLDLSSGIVTSGEQNTVTLNSGSAPEVIITNSDDSTAQVTIQNGTTITTDAGWNGTFTAPQQVSATGITPAGFQIGDTVIEVGAPGHKLTLDAPATIFLPGVRGPVGYKAGDSDTWVRIEASCSGTFEAPVLPDGEQQCHKADSTGTKILTLSFSSFAALDAESSGGSSSGGTSGTRTRASVGTSTTEPEGRVLGASTVAVAHVFASEMGNGSSGDEVSALQAFLIARGYLQIAAPTGYFGPMTEAALKLYQGSKGISATGYFGPLTLAAVNGEQETSVDAQIATLKAQLDVLVKELQMLLDAQK